MTENEMIDYINFLLGNTRCYSEKITKEDSVNMYRLRQENVKLRKMLMEYAEIGTIEELQALKEKSEPKKAILSRKHHEAYCPNCHFVISDGEFYLLDEYVHYCED